jgi:predicted ATP-dependent serine protease
MTPGQREPELLGQTVVLIGGSAGIGLETLSLEVARNAAPEMRPGGQQFVP